MKFENIAGTSLTADIGLSIFCFAIALRVSSKVDVTKVFAKTLLNS